MELYDGRTPDNKYCDVYCTNVRILQNHSFLYLFIITRFVPYLRSKVKRQGQAGHEGHGGGVDV